jgi:DNA-binding transcriptional ArsR family regulator
MHTAPDDLFRALADPTRRALLERLLREGELNVRALTEESGMSQPAVRRRLGLGGRQVE